MKKLLFAAALAVAVMTACDDELIKDSKNIVEGVVINDADSPLYGLWECYDEDYGYAMCFDFTRQNYYNMIEYERALEGSVTQLKNNLEPKTAYYTEVPVGLPFIQTFTLKNHPEVGAFLIYEDMGMFYWVNGDKCTLWGWSLEELPVDEAKQMIAEFASDDEFWKDLNEKEEPIELQRSSTMHAVDLTKNSISGWAPTGEDYTWHYYDAVPFYSGGRVIATNTPEFYLYFNGIQGTREYAYIIISESLWGKEIRLPEPDWDSKYGKDASIRIDLISEWRQYGNEDIYKRETLWSIDNNSTLEQISDALDSGKPQAVIFFTYDDDTRKCKFSFMNQNGYGCHINVDETLEQWH